MRTSLTKKGWWTSISLLIFSLNVFANTDDIQMVGDAVVFQQPRDGKQYTIAVMTPVEWQGDKAVFMACSNKMAYAMFRNARFVVRDAVSRINTDNVLGLGYVVLGVGPKDDYVTMARWTPDRGLTNPKSTSFDKLKKGKLYTQICASPAPVSEVIASLTSDENWLAPVVEEKAKKEVKKVDPELARREAERQARLQAIVDARFDDFKLGEIYNADLQCGKKLRCNHHQNLDLSAAKAILKNGLKENYAIYNQEVEAFIRSQPYNEMRLLTAYRFTYSGAERNALYAQGKWVPESVSLDEKRQIHSYEITKRYPNALPEQVVVALNELYKADMTTSASHYIVEGGEIFVKVNVISDTNSVIVSIRAQDNRPVQAIHDKYVAEAEEVYTAFLQKKLAEIEKKRNKSFSL